MCRLYKAYILPHLEYCCPLLLGVGRGQVKKLEDTNNYILVYNLGNGKNTQNIPLTNPVRGPYRKLLTEFFPFDLWPKREVRGP